MYGPVGTDQLACGEKSGLKEEQRDEAVDAPPGQAPHGAIGATTTNSGGSI